jgi:hypothetical protein
MFRQLKEKNKNLLRLKLKSDIAKITCGCFPTSTRKGLGAIRAKIGPTSDVDNIFFKMYSQYVLFRKTRKNGKKG